MRLFLRRFAVLAVLAVLASFVVAPVLGYADTGQPPFVYGLILPENGGTFTDDQGNTCAGGKCYIGYGNGKYVNLTVQFVAHPAAGYTFTGWSGACKGTGTCTVNIVGGPGTPDTNLTATFAPAPPPTTTPPTSAAPSTSSRPPTSPTPVGSYRVLVTTQGPGTVTSSPAGVACGQTCQAGFASGTRVVLTANPASGAVFTGWGGDCANAGTAPQCTFTVLSRQTVTASFAPSATPTASAVGFTVPAQVNALDLVPFQVTVPAGLALTGLAWDFEQTGRPSRCAANQPVAYHTFTRPGTYVVTLRATSPAGSTTAQQQVTVGGSAPSGYPLARTAATDIACAANMAPLTGPNACVQTMTIDTLVATALTGCFRPLHAQVTGPPGVGTASPPPTAGKSTPELGQRLTSTASPVNDPVSIRLGSDSTTMVPGSVAGYLQAHADDGIWQADGAVDLNGLDLLPTGSGKIRVNPQENYLAGRVRVTVHGGEAANRGRPFVLGNDISLTDVFVDAADPGDVVPLGAFTLGPQSDTSVFDIPAVGGVQTVFGDDGTTRMTINAQLPPYFRDVRLGTLSGQLGLVVDDAGLHLDDVSLQAQNINLGFCKINDFELSYADHDYADDNTVEHHVWSGAVSLGFGPEGGGLEGAFKVADDYLRYIRIGANIPDPGVHLWWPNTFLTELHAQMGFTRNGALDTLGGGLSVAWGEKVHVPDAHDDFRPVEVDGDITYRGGDPWQAALTGTVLLVGIQVANAEVDINGSATTGNGGFEIHGQINVQWLHNILQLNVSADGGVFCHGSCDWMFGLGGNICLLALCAGGEGVVSSVGLGACAHLSSFGNSWDVGAGYTWGAASADVMGTGCSLDRWRVALNQRPAGYTGSDEVLTVRYRFGGGAPAQVPAPAPTTLTLSGNTREQVIAVRGSTAPPAVTVVDPAGEMVTSTPGATKPQFAGRYLVLTSPTDNTTYVLIAKPRAGTYTVTPVAASAPIDRIEYAAELSDPNVTATVVPGRDGTMQLRYGYTAVPGRTVQFLETAKATRASLGTATSPTGTISFTPTDGPAGERSVTAIVSQNGTPVSQVVVTHYAAPGRQLPARPQTPTARYVGTGLTVNWQPANNGYPASGYAVLARFASGRAEQYFTTPDQRSVHIPAVYPDEQVTISVMGILADGKPGPAADVTYPLAPVGHHGTGLWWWLSVAVTLVLAAAGVLVWRLRSASR